MLPDSLGAELVLPDSLGAELVLPDSLGAELVLPDSLGRHPKKTKLRYEPQDIILRYFTENKQRRYFQRPLRDERHLVTLLFGAPQDSLPVMQWLPVITTDSIGRTDSITVAPTMYVVQPSQKRDTVNIWLIDSLLIRTDTLSMVMTYMFTDSTFTLVPQPDTVQMVYREPRMSEKAREALERKRRERRLEVKANNSSSFDSTSLRPMAIRVSLSQFTIEEQK